MVTALKEPKKVVPLFIAALFFLTLYINSAPYAIKVSIYPVYREIKKNYSLLSARDFTVRETSDFRIYYKNINKKNLDIIEENAKESIKKVTEDLGYSLKEKINIIVYPKYEEMADKIGLDMGIAAMGVYYGGIISILDPSEWIKDTDDIQRVFKTEGPMVHELTHYIIDYMSGGNVPVWYTEGLALYEEYRINNIAWGQNKKYRYYYDIDMLEKNFYGLDEIKAYKQSFLTLKYLGENYGMGPVIEVVKKLKEGKDIDQSIRFTFGIEAEELMKTACSN